MRCPHEECKANAIPDTTHWACTKKNGITALLIGSLRDLRVNYYKNLSNDQSLTEDQRQQYTVVSQALKVILNASYGVMGAEIFPLYFLPAAEATTAVFGTHAKLISFLAHLALESMRYAVCVHNTRDCVSIARRPSLQYHQWACALYDL